MGRSKRYPREIRERAVALVLEHESEYRSRWSCVESVAGKFGMTPETLRLWVKQHEIDHGTRVGESTAEREEIKDLKRENRELRRANEILKAASAFFARELDPRPPRK